MKQYTMKPLEWNDDKLSKYVRVDAQTVFGTILIMSATDFSFWFCSYPCNRPKESHDYPTLEAAKAAAERWYVEQLEQALNPTGE